MSTLITPPAKGPPDARPRAPRTPLRSATHGAYERRQIYKGLAFTSPWLVGFCVFTITPILLSLWYSFCDYTMFQSPVYVGTENYRDLMNDPIFWRSLRNTFYYAAMALPAGLCVSVGLAMLLNVKMPGQAVFRTIIFLPSLVPVVASAMLWMWLFNAKYGLFNELLRMVGIEGPGWLSDANWAMPSLVLMSFWGVGNAVVIYLAGLQDVPRELYEAAEIDGAGVWGRMWHVTLPMLSPVIFFNSVMAIIGVLQTLEGPYIMTQGGPARATLFIAMYLRQKAFDDMNMGYASAMAWVMLLIVVSITALFFWSSRRWVHYQGK